MDVLAWAGVLVFVFAVVLIIFEHKISIDKSFTVLVAGMFMWVLVAFQQGDKTHDLVKGPVAEIAEVILFLLFAMILVKVLEHYRLFDYVQKRIYRMGLPDWSQIWVISAITAVMSAMLDNLTTTIIMINIAKGFFRGKNFLVSCCVIVVAANIGGAPSPIGDVTTLMLWVNKKFTAFEVIAYGTFAAFAMWLVATYLFSRKIDSDSIDVQPEEVEPMTKSEVLVIALTLLSFPLPILFVAVFHLPSFFGLALGLGIVGFVIAICKRNLHDHETHLAADIVQMTKETDVFVLKFFVGILAAVSGLNYLGVLPALGDSIFGKEPSENLILGGNVVLGLLSSMLDNIPLVALGIKLVPSLNPQHWVLLALTAGTGGSIFSFGSAAGVVATGIVADMNRKGEFEHELNFTTYLKLAFWPAVISFFVGAAVYIAQFKLIN